MTRHRLVLDESYILGRLREAGVPVLGVFSFQGLERGRLERRDCSPMETVFTWYEDETDA